MKHLLNIEDFNPNEISEGKKWIPKDLKKGALKDMLGYDEDETIPKGILDSIVDQEIGSTIEVKGKKIKTTKLMKQRANLARNFSKMD